MARDLRYPHAETLERLQRGQGLWPSCADGARVALDVAGFGRDPRLFPGPTRPSGGEVPPTRARGYGVIQDPQVGNPRRSIGSTTTEAEVDSETHVTY